MAPQQEDRGVDPHIEEITVDGKVIIRETPHEVDGLGEPAAPEDDLAGD